MGFFNVKPAPKADTSLSRVISFQLTSASILTSTRTGSGSEIRWIRLSSFSIVGDEGARSIALAVSEEGVCIWGFLRS
jgi:hypothetical protein